MATISASLARRTLSSQLDRAEAGEEISITRRGQVVAILVHPDVLNRRRASDAWLEADRIGVMLESARSQPLRPAAFSAERAQDLVESVNRDRATRYPTAGFDADLT